MADPPEICLDDQTDLETAMDAYASWLEQQRENEIVPLEADR